MNYIAATTDVAIEPRLELLPFSRPIQPDTSYRELAIASRFSHDRPANAAANCRKRPETYRLASKSQKQCHQLL
ncbi:MAG: hypothetical protein AAFY57_10515 [Cyanobacteria bacterium J06642_2]